MKKFTWIITGLIVTTLVNQSVVWADDYVPADEEENAGNTFILDADNTGGDISLQFGETLAEFIKWNDTGHWFEFSDETLVLDASNTGSGENISIIANQGSDSDGELRYNATDNQWQASNNGDTLAPITRVFTGTNALLANESQLIVNHSDDPNHLRSVEIKQQVANPTGVNDSLDFDTADETNYVQENAATGTDFLGGAVKLYGTYSGSGTTNVAQGQTATASSSTQPASNGVDGDDNTFWYTTSGGATGGWFQVDMGSSPPTINQSSIRWYNTSNTYNCSTFKIQGSNTDGSGYVDLWTGDTGSGGQEQTYNFSPATYRYWRFLCEVAYSSTYYVVREFRLFEALATYPTTPYYVTTGTNSLNTSNWTGITTFDITQNTPTNTSVLYLFSFDGKTTWKYWNGSAWATSSLANLQVDGMTETEVEALSSSNWFATGGINSDAAETFDVAFDLDTNDSSESPVVDQISITYTTPDYWEVTDNNYTIQEFSDTETVITNNTGSTQNVIINVVVP